jgi:hypothetical protein
MDFFTPSQGRISRYFKMANRLQNVIKSFETSRIKRG